MSEIQTIADIEYDLLGSRLASLNPIVAQAERQLVLQRDFVTSHPVAPGCACDGTDRQHGSASEYTACALKPREA